jgi:TolB-like protein
MRRISGLIAGLCVLFCAGCASTSGGSGELPRLAILPFTGGTAENGETIAMLLSNRPEIQNVFTAVPRTSISNLITREAQFQRSGLIDFDTLSKLGNDLKADFVVAGYTQQFAERNLLLINVINVHTLQQVAGDYREYTRVEDIRSLIPEMAKKIAGIKRDDANKSRLAVFPFDMPQGTVQDAEILAQILAIDLANSGRYAVYPRTQTIAQVLEEHKQPSDLSDPDSIRELGHAVGADYVLAGLARNLESTKLFFVEILDVEKRSLVSGSQVEYQSISDGLILIPELAKVLTGQKTVAQMEEEWSKAAAKAEAEAKQVAAKAEAERKQAEAKAEQERKQAEAKAEAERKQAEAKAEAEAYLEEKKEYAFRNYIDVLAGPYVVWGDGVIGGGDEIGGIHWSFLPFTSIGVDILLGGSNRGSAGGFDFNAGFVWPLTSVISLFGDGIFRIGWYGLPGLIAEPITPGFDAGISFDWGKDSDFNPGFDITYKGVWYAGGRYLHSLGASLILSFGESWKAW